MTEIIFAGAPYSNSAPLVERLAAVDARVRVISDHPSRLVSDLREGRADVALIPVAHLFAHPELRMIEGLGIAADGPVRSVLLKCNVPVEQIRRVRRDPASATSNALAELLLQRHYGCEVTMTDRPGADAAVMIGDRALCSEPAPAGDIDLAEAWKAMTGLPFVFAVWAVRSGFDGLAEASAIAHRACEEGLQALERIAARYADQYGRTPSFWHGYLSEVIHYRLDGQDLAGMEWFRSLLGQQDGSNQSRRPA